MESFFHRRTYSVTARSGFTLVEMLIVLAIIGVITTITLSSQSAFNKTLILTNTAYDIGLTIRSAQTYGIGGRAEGNTSNVGYGIDFDIGKPKSFILFADTSPGPTASNCHGLGSNTVATAPDAVAGDCVYKNGDQKIKTYLIGNGVTIKNFCIKIDGTNKCARSNSSVSPIDIVFSRPNADTFFAGGGSYKPLASSVCIKLSSTQNTYRYIKVGQSGEIQVSATSCM